jgi:hypothetical protein
VLWESGRALHPLDKGLLAVRAAFPEYASQSVADWPLGRRNRALAEARCAWFGPRVRGWVACEQCGEKLEFDVDGSAIAAEETPREDVCIDWRGGSFRLPTSRDLAFIAEGADASHAAVMLLERCEVERTARSSAWDEAQLEEIGERMVEADPLAEILLHFDCPMCGEGFDQALDLAAFLWSELESKAKLLMREVHELALAYGWNESEIVSLGPARRNFYLEMVRA